MIIKLLNQNYYQHIYLKFKLLFLLIIFFSSILNNPVLAQLSEFEAEDLIKHGNQLMRDKDYNNALEDYNHVLKFYPANAEALFARGLDYMELKKFQLAIYDFNRSIASNEKVIYSYLYRGIAYDELDNFNNALSDFNQALRLAPNTPGAYINRAKLYTKHKNYFNAINDLSEAIRLKPDTESAYIMRSQTYLLMHKYHEAMIDCLKALDLNPNSSNAYILLGQIDFKQNNYQSALENTNKAIEIEPSNNNLYYLDGICYYLTEDFKDAATLFAHGAKSADNTRVYSTILGYLAYSNPTVNNETKAKQLLTNLTGNKSKWPMPVIQYLKSEITDSQLLKIAKSNDELTEAHCYIGLNFLLKEQTPIAKSELQWVIDHGNKEFTEYSLALAFVDYKVKVIPKR